MGIRLTLTILASVVALVACVALGYPPVVVACTAISCVGLALTCVFTTASDLLQGLQRFPTVAGVNMAAGLALTAGSVVAVWAGGGAVATAASYLIGPVVATGLFIGIIRRQHFPVRVRWDLWRFRSLLWQARFIGLQQLVGSANQYAEALMVPRMLGETPFGYFAAGTLLSSRLTAIPDGIGTAAYPVIARKHATGGRAAVVSTGQFLGLVAAICVAAAVGVSLLAHPIAGILFPGRAAICAQVMRVSIWLLPLMGVQCVLGYALNAVHADAAQAKASLAGSVISIALAVVLIRKFGLEGAAWSMVVRYALQIVVLIPCVVRTARRLLQPEEDRSDEPAVAESGAPVPAPAAAGA
jgi:O-antigen/teichoic acid export membrane protein